MDFRNTSSQNRKAIKSERDSRSHTKSKIKGPPTQISTLVFGKFQTKLQIKYLTLISR